MGLPSLMAQAAEQVKGTSCIAWCQCNKGRALVESGVAALDGKGSSMRIKYALPIAQMILTSLLMRWDSALQIASWRTCDMPGPTPAVTVLISINAPLALPFAIWNRYLSYNWSFAILIVAVGLFWYWIGLNAEAWRHRKKVLMFSWRPAQSVTDTLLVASGIVFGLLGASRMLDAMHYAHFQMQGRGCFGPNPWFTLVPDVIIACCLLGWAFTLVFFFGRDLMRSARRHSAA